MKTVQMLQWYVSFSGGRDQTTIEAKSQIEALVLFKKSHGRKKVDLIELWATDSLEAFVLHYKANGNSTIRDAFTPKELKSFKSEYAAFLKHWEAEIATANFVEETTNEYADAFRKLFDGVNMKSKKKTTIVIGEYDVEVDSLPDLGRYERLIEAYDFISRSESLIEGDAEFTKALIKRVKEFSTFMKKWNGTNGIEEEVYLGYKNHCVRVVEYAKATLEITSK